MDFVNKILRHFENNGYIYVCVGLFIITITIICSLLFVGITKLSGGDGQDAEKPQKTDTTYVILQSEIEEVRMAIYSVSKDSIWVAPTSSKVTIRDNRK